jgi:hypothetical protein
MYATSRPLSSRKGKRPHEHARAQHRGGVDGGSAAVEKVRPRCDYAERHVWCGAWRLALRVREPAALWSLGRGDGLDQIPPTVLALCHFYSIGTCVDPLVWRFVQGCSAGIHSSRVNDTCKSISSGWRSPRSNLTLNSAELDGSFDLETLKF